MAKVFISLSSVTHIAISSGAGADEETEAQSQQVLCSWDGEMGMQAEGKSHLDIL